MEAIVTIQPTLGQPGLIGYERSSCVYVTSELVTGSTPRWNDVPRGTMDEVSSCVRLNLPSH